MSVDFYIYAADVYCEDCAKDIKRHIHREGNRPEHYRDETTYDSSEWPKGPYYDDESDSPQHCGNHDKCLDPLILNGVKYGKFLENTLTSHGEEYVKEIHRDHPSNITEFWMEYYSLREED